jgi:hypothetical protein
MSRSLLTAFLLGLTVMPLSNPATAAEPSPSPSGGPRIWLSGAFGRVPGGDTGSPASAPPGHTPLDTWIRGAPLDLQVDVVPEDLLAVEVVSRRLDGAGEERLSSEATRFAGPDAPGLTVLVATVTTVPYGRSQHAWLLAVPDRAGGEEALLGVPAPVATLTSTSASVAGEPGNGCYIYLCVDVGYQPPAASLEALPAAVGETLSLALDDRSAMIGWTGTITPLTGTSTPLTAGGSETRMAGAETRIAEAGPGLTPSPVVELTGLEPTAVGQWLLQVRADLDRERGWQWFVYRVVVE